MLKHTYMGLSITIWYDYAFQIKWKTFWLDKYHKERSFRHHDNCEDKHVFVRFVLKLSQKAKNLQFEPI